MEQQTYAIVMGASSGGVSALIEVIAGLPADLPAIVAVALHVGGQRSILPELLQGHSALPTRHAVDGEALRPGTIYVAPPDHHLLLSPEGARLSRGPRENHARPAIDPLFRSAALHWRSRCIGVVLTGDLDDGTAGLAAIKACGGTAIVQDPASAFNSSMPASALAHVAVDHCLALGEIAAALAQRMRKPSADRRVAPTVVHEQSVFEGDRSVADLRAIASPSTDTCPDCGGALWELHDPTPIRYRCHIGHAFSDGSLRSQQARETEIALRTGVRSLQARVMLLRRLAEVSAAVGDAAQAAAGRREADRLLALNGMVEKPPDS